MEASRAADCLSDVGCEFIQLRGGRVGRESRDHLIQMFSLSLDHFLKKILVEGRPAERRGASGGVFSAPIRLY